MTKEEAIAYIHEWLKDEYALNSKDKEALDMAIEALEQESILDKIRAEIMNTGAYEQEVNGKTEFLKGINYCLSVIDKYKAESKEEE